MGGGESKSTQEKSVDTTGNVNNNVIVDNEVPIVSKEIVLLLSAIVILQVFQLCMYIYA